ncbi:QueT transporter family protein [Enterococcus ratti]|uniref:ECF transporter substrate-specific protein QueT n=1 Tax=Enterococcus ratti TaxID=150033 RepID=A0A1L8WIC4_9ENTE|nr:QueT transporter family protein [Enterococcus ratti]OJG80774.1 ECF transporter substrate-specific protein QueT [Enterococcus ratti]
MQKTKDRQRLKIVVVNGIVMALYLALTILVAPVSSGPIQFRISESLNHLVVFNRKLLWGILGGVIVYNAFFGFGLLDVIYGGGQTLFALTLTALLQNKIKSVKTRLAINTAFFTVSMGLIAYMLVPTVGRAFWTTYGTLALSEFIIMAVSAPLMYYLNRSLTFETRV